MRKSAENIVKELHPNAFLERQRSQEGEVYWLVRLKHPHSPQYLHLPHAKTKTKAWKNAAAKLEQVAALRK